MATNEPSRYWTRKQRAHHSWGGYQAPPSFIRTQSTNRRKNKDVPSENKLPRLRWVVAVLLLVVVGYSWFSTRSLPGGIVSPFSHRIPASFESMPKLRLSSSGSIQHTVASGETWDSICLSYGFGRLAGKQLHDALRELASEAGVSKSIRSGQKLLFSVDSEQGLLRVETKVSATASVILEKDPDIEGFTGRLEKIVTVNEERVIVGSISSERRTFAEAMLAAGGSYELVDEFVDLFSDRVRFRQDFRLGDRFSVLYQASILSDGRILTPKHVLAAAIDVNGKRMMAIRFLGSDKKARYFTGTGKHLDSSFLRYPLKFTRISSLFTNSRFHPVLKRRRPHRGVDFAAPRGTPIRTVAHGKVLFAGRKGGNGIMAKIKHTDRYTTAYLHMSKLAKGIRTGVSVERGQVIGYVGSTGLATGPHLHFSFYDRGKYVDPLKIKLPAVENLDDGQKIDDSFRKQVVYTLTRYQDMDFSRLPGSIRTPLL